MKITNVYEGVVPIRSSIRNAWIDFSSMDCSIVAIESDVIRDGKPVVGYGFNSNGRYSAGDRKSTRQNSSHMAISRMPSSA